MSESYVYAEQDGAGADAPTLFLFHGTGGDENQFLGLGGQLLPGARLVAPRGDVSEGGALRYFKRTGEGRYDMADLARATVKTAGFVTAHKGGTEAIGFGYSNGANIIASVLFHTPAAFDKAVLLHPLIPFEPAPQPGLAGKPILITAGRRDGMCPAPQTEALVAWFEAQGAAVTVFWHDGGHEIRQEELLAVRDWLAK
ncbi:MAG: alpha/beta hydrolase [Hyphomicrobiales bacterium]|nr:MAG: alpha/beta hydrolase [Hyphomicrobiales bacterium]